MAVEEALQRGVPLQQCVVDRLSAVTFSMHVLSCSFIKGLDMSGMGRGAFNFDAPCKEGKKLQYAWAQVRGNGLFSEIKS